jgi:hypothetical protein
MTSLIPLVLVTLGLLTGTAVAFHALQLLSGNQRIRDNPGHYVAVQATGIAVEQAQLRGQLGFLRTALNHSEQQLTQDPARPERLLLKGLCVAFLPVAFALSASQLIPSFRTLTGAPWIVDALLGLLAAAVEIGAALFLRHHLRPEGGWRPLAAKIGAAVAASFALLVIVAQLTWAPAHDVIPQQAQIAAAREQLAEDVDSGASSTIVTTDRQQISVLTDRLDEARTRDQGLALMVTLGSDLAVWPAIDALGYLTPALRRRRLRRRVTSLRAHIDSVEQAIEAVPIRVTHRVQRKLQRLGIDPALATAPPPPPGAGTAGPPHAGNGTTTPPPPGAGTAGPPHAGNGTTTPPPPGAGTAGPPHAGNGTTTPPPPGAGTAAGGVGEPLQPADPGAPPDGWPITPDDLFRLPSHAGDDGRWTDPLF